MSDKIYVDDVGTVITVDCGTTVSGASDTTLEVKKPDGTTVSWSASASGDDLIVTIQSGDFSVAGVYILQAKCTISGWTGKGKSTSFTVYKAFE